MYFQIIHRTTYTYSRPVFLEAHCLRLRPRCDGVQKLTHYDVNVLPRPLGMADGIDLDGNVTSNVWFEGLTDKLMVESYADVLTHYRNPFHYLLAERADRLPISYLDPVQIYLAPYTRRQNESHFVEQFARHIANSTEWKTLRFLTALNREIYECCCQTVREHGETQPAEETFLRKRGSARDLALLFLDACRYLGIAARFVNGYHETSADAGKRYLHSWGEVYLPGIGWRGYDPSQGLAVTDRHVTLAAAGIPLLAAPVIGTFRGNAVTSELTVGIDIRAVSDNETAAPVMAM